jgi:putative chitinase
MPLVLTREGMRAVLPRAPLSVIDAFVDHQDVLAKAGVLETRPRFAFAIANVEHECSGFTIPNLTENIHYTAARMAAVWPHRFSSANAVRERYGTAPGWQRKAFDDIYGNRMGNRPGTHDGSTYIGRGGPQITGADGYEAVGARCGLPLKAEPELATKPEHQPAILAGFVSWKGLNRFADTGNFVGGVKVWNGGTNGLTDRRTMLAGNDTAIARLEFANAIMPALKKLPGGPSTGKPPKDVLDAATAKERKARAAGAGGATLGGASEAAASKRTGTHTEQPVQTLLPPLVAWTLIGAGVGVVLIAAWLIARKHAAVLRNWF